MTPTLRVRWLGSVPYADAHALQQGLFSAAPAPGHDRPDDWLLLLEHPPVYTLGVRADLGNLLVPPAEVGAELVRADRGGDVTYHGPGQLVGYPVLTVAGKRGGGATRRRGAPIDRRQRHRRPSARRRGRRWRRRPRASSRRCPRRPAT